MRHPGREAAEQGKMLHALRLLFQPLAFRHFLVEGGGAFLHALFERAAACASAASAVSAVGQFGLHLLVELRILEGHGRVGGQPHQDSLIPVGKGRVAGFEA